MQSFKFSSGCPGMVREEVWNPHRATGFGVASHPIRQHALICAPTGSGKTLAAFMAALDHLFTEGSQTELAAETRVLYVSPLRALSNDIRKNLQEPLQEIRTLLREKIGRDVDVRVQVRTGDTPAAERQAIAKKAPSYPGHNAGIVYLLLTSESGRAGPEDGSHADHRRNSCTGRRPSRSAFSPEHGTARTSDRGAIATDRAFSDAKAYRGGRSLPGGWNDASVYHRRFRPSTAIGPRPGAAGRPIGKRSCRAKVWEEVYRRLRI